VALNYRRFRRAVTQLRTPVGRALLIHDVSLFVWPFARDLARIYRLTLGSRIRVITVVGSLGKTGTTRMVFAGLKEGVPGVDSYNAFTYLAKRLLMTPPWSRCLVLEVGVARKGDMAVYSKMLRPDIVVVTCIASEHHNTFKDFETTRSEKAEMVKGLTERGLAVLNGDDPNVVWMKECTRSRVVTYGLGSANDIRASCVKLDWPQGMSFRIHADGFEMDVRSKFLGNPSVYSFLAAIAVAMEMGYPVERSAKRMMVTEATPARCQIVHLDSGAKMIRDEFKSSFETVEHALDLLERVPAMRRIVIIGDVEEPVNQHLTCRLLGARIAGFATNLISIGSERADYAAGAARAGMPRSSIVKARSIAEAIQAVPSDLGPGDVVLVKGRSTQRLDRISLALMGRKVNCSVQMCQVKLLRCQTCPMLGRGLE
jgi:UDP-N-acetylmuramyl pentapeptide synthase